MSSIRMLSLRKLLPALLLPALLNSHSASAELEVSISYLQLQQDTGPVLSNVLPEPEDSGLRGAELGIDDSNTTGRFLKQKYSLSPFTTDDESKFLATAEEQYKNGQRLFISNAPASTLTALRSQLPDDALLFNSGSPADQLRTENCKGVLHTLASRAMLTDALAQWLKARRLEKVLIITGNQPADKAYSEAFRRGAKRFGLKIVAEKAWQFDADLRRTAQKEMPLFTQADEYDVVFIADERGDFGEYVLYNTWYPRPVVGTQGLKPVTWHRVVEQWGAAQLQSRFNDLANRWMTSKDYAAWAAVRSIAEAVTRTGSNNPEILNQYIRSDDFQLAAFKGRKLNYRSWNGQMRQPIPLIHPRSLVSQSPQEGFLHPLTELDTLGFDQRETRCHG